ncbi:MAG TPA: ATP synthase F1 subunit gamma [Patescibacteria group bacterium]|jgi:F-type H+-transporting ATPase subunit gamma
MASTRDIKRRLSSIDNTRQITRAMEMVAATKMRKAQAAVRAGREYGERAQELLNAVSAEADGREQPLLARRPIKRTGVVLVTSDRGLAGAMNTNVLKAGLGAAKGGQSTFVPVGRKAEQALSARKLPMTAAFSGLLDTPEYQEVLPIAEILINDFTEGKLDAIDLVYPRFVSTLRNEPVVERLLPATLPEKKEGGQSARALLNFEPSPEEVLTALLPRLIEIRLFTALLETKASEHSARMIAMRNATGNAEDLLDALKLSYNQARQQAITTEIAEISAASATK